MTTFGGRGRAEAAYVHRDMGPPTRPGVYYEPRVYLRTGEFGTREGDFPRIYQGVPTTRADVIQMEKGAAKSDSTVWVVAACLGAAALYAAS